MYGFSVGLIIVFLTHPGVAYNFFDPGIPGALFQCLVVLLMNLPATGKPGFAATMGIVYWVMLGLWAYIKVKTIRLQ